MGKSSSSTKKKRSKYLSPGRTKKRSKSKKTKSKKLRRRHDSDSYSDYESDSTSVSSSSSDDSYKGRKCRSYSRKDVKVSKKKSRAWSSTSEGSPRVRKRKRSKRNDDFEGRKKIREKSRKKSRRDPSVSSRSSVSESDASEDSDDGRKTKRSERRDGSKNAEKVKSRNRRKRFSSSSSSSYNNQDEDFGQWSEKEMNIEVNSKRLRSVVVIAKEDDEGTNIDKDENKGEMIYDHDDYPSSRSNESNDGAVKGDLVHQSSFESERKRDVEGDQQDNAVTFKNKPLNLPKTDKDREGQDVASKLEPNMVTTDQYDINNGRNEFSGVIGSTDGDLESILRQRALENLKRFRGGSQSTLERRVNPKDDSNSSLKLASAAEAQSGQNTSSKNDGASAVQEGSIRSMLKDDTGVEVKNADSESVLLERKVHLPDAGAGRPNIRPTIVHQRIKRPRLVESALKQAFSDATATVREAASLQEFNRTKSVLGNSVHIGSSQTSHIVNSQSQNSNLDKAGNVPLRQESLDAAASPVEVTTSRESNQEIMAMGSSGQVALVTPECSNSDNTKTEKATSINAVEPSHIGSSDGEIGSNKLEDEGKDSQLQQKTMSVMRNGELVQVSYKVYIPQKAPALARRRLKR